MDCDYLVWIPFVWSQGYDLAATWCHGYCIANGKKGQTESVTKTNTRTGLVTMNSKQYSCEIFDRFIFPLSVNHGLCECTVCGVTVSHTVSHNLELHPPIPPPPPPPPTPSHKLEWYLRTSLWIWTKHYWISFVVYCNNLQDEPK